MRWAALWLWFMGGLAACGPAIPVDGDETGGEDTTGGSTLTGPGSSSSGLPGTSTTMMTSATTLPGTSSTGPDDTGSSTTEEPVPIPDVPEFDCLDAECPAGQWCGPSHHACQDIEEIEPCAGAPTHHAVEVSGVVGSPVATLVVDVDGDADDDIVVLWDEPPAVSVVRQDAGLVPLDPQPLAIASPRHVQVGDLDGDGVRDLGIATATNIYWAPGLGDGTFGALVEQLQVAGSEVGGLGIARASVDDLVDDVVVFVPAESFLVLGLSAGDGTFSDVVDTELEVETMGPFAAVDRGFSEMLVAVGSLDVVYGFDPDPKTFQFVDATSQRITNGGIPIVDVDLARTGGGVFTFAFVNLGEWTLGGIAAQPKGIPTRSRMVVGNGALGFDYAYVTEDDRVLVIEGGCHDAHEFGAAPVAADAGDFDADGRGDLAIALDGVPLRLLLSGPG